MSSSPPMPLMVNQIAVQRSSRGVKRYYSEVMRHLAWPGSVVEGPAPSWRGLDRLRELAMSGGRSFILWSPCQRGPVSAHHHVVTVHDCINLEFVYARDWRRPAYRLLAGTVLRNAERVVAISHATKAAILRNFELPEERILVVQSGQAHLAVRPVSPIATSERPFILMVTNSLPHKNGFNACVAFARSKAAREGITFKIVGSLSDAATRVCQDQRVRLEVHSHVSDEQLAAWYRECLFLLSPSLEEGHNLTISEGLSCGANVACSDIPVHREFYDGQALFFDPRAVDNIAQTIDEGLERGGRWFPDVRMTRNFADVAADYRSLFLSLGRHP